MTEPSQYFKGRTVQEQMNEVIGYVDARAEEVAAAKADDVLEPAEQAKTDAIAAKEAAEDARDVTLAALPAIQQDIADLKAEDVSLDGRLDTVELKVQTAEGNIVTIQGQIVALQTADGQNVKINSINDYAVGLTGNQDVDGVKRFLQLFVGRKTRDFSTNASGLTLLYKRTNTRQQWLIGVSGHSLILANVQGNTKINTRVITNNDRPYSQPIMYICRDSEDVITVWGVAKYNAVVNWYLFSNMQYSTDYVGGIEIVNQQYANANVPVVGDVTPYDPNATYTEVYPSTDFESVR